MAKAGTTRLRWRIEGIVQGVGFRPFVASAARRAGLVGFCGNDEQGVFIEVEGSPDAQEQFQSALFSQLPALARIINHSVQRISPLLCETDFTIIASRHSDSGRSLLPPDTAVCPDCRREFLDPTNPRYLYPFISCTNCGPRLSIIRELPYDRPRTTMADFPMCAPCSHEYSDPTDRRYHAQPISCFDCGPRLQLVENGVSGAPAVTRAEVLALIERAHALLDDGSVLAVKGIGGFHLVCDATNDAACGKLRDRKRRPDKPLAVMAPSVSAAAELVELSDAERSLLDSPEAPIVIASKRVGSALSRLIAPGLDSFGVMIPYSGIHILLCDRPLVVTSGNISGEPVCTGNNEALAKLDAIADAFILHDRDIHIPVEDSVFIGTTPSRRSRGFAPVPIAVSAPKAAATATASPTAADTHTLQGLPTVFATGGELKNTFAVAHGGLVHVSAHVGDMASWASQQAYRRATAQLLSMRGVVPEVVVCDLHPGYATTSFAERFADEHGVELIAVQHHWAHALSLLAEQRLLRPGTSRSALTADHGNLSAGPDRAERLNNHDRAVIATLDGTGYGTDGTIWGGEILSLSTTDAEWKRVWHFPAFPLVGGDRAVTHPWRLAVGLAHAWKLDDTALRRSLHIAHDVTEQELELVESQLSTGIGAVATSSLGRIFDAAAALLLPRWAGGAAISYDAQAAMELEAAATRYVRSHPDGVEKGPRGIVSGTASAAPADVIRDALLRSDPEEAAFAFHCGVARVVGKQLVDAAAAARTTTIGVSGGCGNNELLMALLDREVSAAGLHLLQHQIVPPGDGGLSLGQAMAARLLLLPDTQ